MNKNIALIALLLPFSGYAITKEERKQEIQAQLKKLDEECAHLMRIVESNLFFAACCPEYFRKRAEDIDTRGAALEIELEEINKQLEQEKA